MRKFWRNLWGLPQRHGISMRLEHHGRAISPKFEEYLRHGYPSNHRYLIRRDRFVPTRQLAVRYDKIAELYPAPLTSLLDLSCCKGFFVFAAAAQPHCQRAAGIDVN